MYKKEYDLISNQILFFHQLPCRESYIRCLPLEDNQFEKIGPIHEHLLESWMEALELHDKATAMHSRRMIHLTLQLAVQFGITEPELTHIRRGVLLHDFGKMAISDQILKKPGPLNVEEMNEMQRHPQYAYEFMFPIPFLHPALVIPYCHHERWDGTGYPRGLKGTQIPLAARLFAVVDVWDALSHDRPYRKAWPSKKVLRYLREQSGKQFDPQVLDTFMKLIRKKHQ